MSRNYFEGWYYRHQASDRILAVIPGRARDHAFVQVVTDKRSYNAVYPLARYIREKDCLVVGGNAFTPGGIRLAVDAPGLALHGALRYKGLVPIRGDIMGPFRFFPMECRHGVVSMRHGLSGSVQLNGETLDFTGGVGYIESDRGRSFPQSYAWILANDFDRDCSIMASAAEIPFMGLQFRGCICVVWLEGREYRLATYRGAKVLRCEPNALLLRQGRYRMEIQVAPKEGCALNAPQLGAMSRVIRETAACPAHFRFSDGSAVLFEGKSERAAHEYVST